MISAVPFAGGFRLLFGADQETPIIIIEEVLILADVVSAVRRGLFEAEE